MVVFVPYRTNSTNIANVGIFDSSDNSLQIYPLAGDRDYRFAGGAAVDDIIVFAPQIGTRSGCSTCRSISRTQVAQMCGFVGAMVDGLVVFAPCNQNHLVTFDVNTKQVQQYAMEIANGPSAKFLTGTAVGSKVFFAPATVNQVGVFDVQHKTFALAGAVGSAKVLYSAAAISSVVYFAPHQGGNDVLVFNTENNETESVPLTLPYGGTSLAQQIPQDRPQSLLLQMHPAFYSSGLLGLGLKSWPERDCWVISRQIQACAG